MNNNLSAFEQGLALGDYTGTITVTANVFHKDDVAYFKCITTKTKLRNALARKTRYSAKRVFDAVTENKQTKKAQKELLNMVCYRAKDTDAKGLALYDEGSCFLGVTKK